MYLSPLPPVPALGAPAWAVVIFTVGYLVLFVPVRGQRSYRRLVASREFDPTALIRFYRRNVWLKWAWLAPILLVLTLAPGLRPAHLGLAWPSGPYLGWVWWLLAYAAAVTIASTLLWRRRVQSGRSVPGLRATLALTPRTRAERRWAGAALISAAVVEELMMRGLLLAAGLSVGLPAWAVVLLTAALFGLVHLYQGWFGVVGTGFMGAVLALSVLMSGSLLFAVAFHLLLAMRALVVLVTVAAAPRAADQPRAAPATR
jgi:Type II CAAX prenyl endopeptidase Rce1-like